MKNKKNKENNVKKIFLVVLLAIAIGLISLFTDSKTRAALDGWGAGIWNNYIAGHAENDSSIPPTIGWLKSSSSVNGPCLKTADSAEYEVYFENTDLGENVRYVSGKAWFGIGSQSDSGADCQEDLPSLGWLNFGGDPGSFCSGQGDCHAARWHKTGGDDYTGYLDGYAKIESMGDSGWIRLRGDNNGEKYKVMMDSSGVLSGYAWSSGEENTISGNSGLGWIKMDGLQIAECDLTCVPKKLCQGSSFSGTSCSDFCSYGSTCAPDLDGETSFTNWTCTRGCGSKSCEPEIIVPENGVCGPVDYICDRNVDESKLCASGTASVPTYYEKTASWTCGNDCGEKVTCSAATQCGWIETNP
ncbi:MAG: hypothetical protein WC831_03495 [Parcubacteria group bacterium]|jgi:hypothetical protein